MAEHGHQHERYAGNATQIALFIIGCLLVAFSLLSVVLIIGSIYHHDKNDPGAVTPRQQTLTRKWKSVKSVNYPTISSATFYFLSTCSFMIALYYFDNEAADNFDVCYSFVIAMVTFVAFIFAAKISIYTQFVARLFASFKGSYLEPSGRTLKLYISLFALSWCAVIWWLVLLSVRYIILEEEFAGYYTQFYFVFALLFICDFTMSWTVVILFTKKLFASTMLQDRSHAITRSVASLQLQLSGFNVQVEETGNGNSDETHTDETGDSDEIGLGDQITHCTSSMLTDICATTIGDGDHRRLDLIRKQVILSAIAILSSQLSYISLLIILIYRNTAGYSDELQPKLYSLYAGIFYPMDVILNCIILYCNYSFANKYYHTFCCCFDRMCKRCVIKCMAKKIGRNFIKHGSTSDISIVKNPKPNVCCCRALCSNEDEEDAVAHSPVANDTNPKYFD